MVNVMANLFLSMQWRHVGGVEVYIHSFLTTAVGGGEWSTSFPCCCTPVKEPQYPLNRRLDGAHSWSGHFGDEKNLLPLLGFKPQIVQPTSYSLYQQACPSSEESTLISFILFGGEVTWFS